MRIFVLTLALYLLPVLASAQQQHRQTGHAYLDESYRDDAGVLHIVISPCAAAEFFGQWPNVEVRLSIVNAANAAMSSGDSSSGRVKDQHVSAYTRADGTYVDEYMRSSPVR